MTAKKLNRIVRQGRLSPEQTACDEGVRRKVQAELSPLPPQSIPETLSEALRTAIRESGLTVYEIAKPALVSQLMISRFLSGERDIRLATADKLANVLRLQLVGRRR